MRKIIFIVKWRQAIAANKLKQLDDQSGIDGDLRRAVELQLPTPERNLKGAAARFRFCRNQTSQVGAFQRKIVGHFYPTECGLSLR